MADTPPSPSAPLTAPKVVIPHKAKWHQRLAARLIYGLIRCVAVTIRFTLEDDCGAFARPTAQHYVFATWHNRLALSLIMYRRYVIARQPQRRLAALVSASKDGGLLARVLELFQVQPVRGSSSRRGAQALRELVTWGEQGFDVAVTPDGPRGPCYSVQEGVIGAAQLIGQPIVPVTYRLNWKIRVKSWDRFQIPLPFARCDVRVGSFLHVPPDATEADRERLRQELETQMRALTRDD